ncbi:hypothetical protein L6164_000203 [Bauhinia variegata]|uniref:Uncharacterized protein n=1 Tax=Bauhinia variegata TaxID=167791 RepID=A0ACB9Q6F0_BAUVA|nr:hypothetical protein L6164_000203 [Bauhinia variegata]
MATKSSTFSLMLCTVLCMAMLLSSMVAAQAPEAPGLIPFAAEKPSSQAVQQCWSSIADIPGCVLEIYTAFISGQFKALSPACCKGIAEVKSDCRQKIFPSIPVPLLYKFCAGQVSLPMAMLTFQGPGLLPPGPVQCWSSLASIQGCVSEIYGAFSSRRFGSIGLSCCNAIKGINSNCWPMMFPMNPLFPPLLTSSCAAAAALVPPPLPRN